MTVTAVIITVFQELGNTAENSSGEEVRDESSRAVRILSDGTATDGHRNFISMKTLKHYCELFVSIYISIYPVTEILMRLPCKHSRATSLSSSLIYFMLYVK